MDRSHTEYPTIGKLFPRGQRSGNLMWALIAARSDLAIAAKLAGTHDETIVPLMRKGQIFEGQEGEFFVRTFFLRASLASIDSIRWLLNNLNACPDFQDLIAKADPEVREEFRKALKTVNQSNELVKEYRNEIGSHVEHDFAATRDRLDDFDTVPVEFSRSVGLCHRTASSVVMVALLKKPKNAEEEFSKLLDQLATAAGTALAAAEIATHLYLQHRMTQT